MKDRHLLILGTLAFATWVLLHHPEAHAEPNPPSSSFAARQTKALETIAEQLKKLNELERRCK